MISVTAQERNPGYARAEIPEGAPMTAQAISLETIEAFLAQKRIAMVGISREPKSISVALFKELCRRGYRHRAREP